jgi:lysophospholipase L1-like esterase
MRFIRLGVVAVVLSLLFAGPAAAVGPGKSGEHAPLYFVSLGDSLSVGEQPGPDGVGRPTGEGYADQLYAIAETRYPNLRLVKFGCMGATTTTVRFGGGRCTYEEGSQLAQAVEFLHAHAKFVAFVTIDIGINDFTCQDAAECVPPGLATIGANLPEILGQLRAAAGPDTPIVGMTYYDPLLGLWLAGRIPDAMLSAQLFALINGTLKGIYAGAAMPVADVEATFLTQDFADLETLPPPFPPLTVPVNVARICEWTWICVPPPQGPNNHANALGYGAIAQTFAAILAL